MTTSFIGSVRAAIRSFRRRPGFFAVAVCSLGIALGLSTAVAALIDALRHPLASNEGVERVYYMGLRGPGPRRGAAQVTIEFLYDVAKAMPGVESVSLYSWHQRDVEVDSRVRRRGVALVPPGYLATVGLTPAIGRAFGADDYSASSVAIVNAAVWRTHFQDRASLDGATIAVDGQVYPIVGVLPPFAQTADVLIPTTEAELLHTGSRLLRLKAGRSPESMTAELAAAAAKVNTAYDRKDNPIHFVLESIQPNPLGLRDYHRAMIGAALGILLIACANVAALMLARGLANRRDYALHLALGATPRDLAKRVAGEVSVLGVCGAVLGVLLALWATKLLTLSVPEDLTNLGFTAPHWNVRVFGGLLAATLLSIAVAAALPAWVVARTNPNEPLKESSGTTTGRSASRFKLLIVAEIALAMTFLVGASLMAKSVRVVTNYDFGYDARNLLDARVSLYDGRTPTRGGVMEQTTPPPLPADRTRLYSETLNRVAALPQVERVTTISSAAPEDHLIISDLTSAGAPSIDTRKRSYAVVGAGFFSTLGIPVHDGRDFALGDRAGVILSEDAARALFPRGGAVGHSVKFGGVRSGAPWIPVVGIAGNAMLGFPSTDPAEKEEAVPMVYAYYPQLAPMSWGFVIRPRQRGGHVLAEIQRTLQDFLPSGSGVLAVPHIANYETKLKAIEYLGTIFVALGAASLLLAAAGLFSVLSFVVSQRMREFAVRIALGARQIDVTQLVFRDALVMALAGTAIGAGFGMWGGFAIWYVMWGVYPVDAEALAIAEVTLIGASLVTCILPAIRAARANPLEVMRAT